MMRAAFLLGIGAIYAFIFAPLVVVVLVSLNGGSVASFPIESWSLRWYGRVLEAGAFTGALWTSLWLGLASTALATPLAVTAALATARGAYPGAAAVEAFLLAPILVPGIVIGIALLVLFSLIEFRGAATRLLLAHLVIALPYCTRTVLASLARLDPSLVEGARSLGADRWRAFLHVTLPLIRPGIAAGMIFAFLQSFGDVPISLFLADARNTTLPLSIMAYLQYSVDPSVAAISSLVTLASLHVDARESRQRLRFLFCFAQIRPARVLESDPSTSIDDSRNLTSWGRDHVSTSNVRLPSRRECRLLARSVREALFAKPRVGTAESDIRDGCWRRFS